MHPYASVLFLLLASASLPAQGPGGGWDLDVSLPPHWGYPPTLGSGVGDLDQDGVGDFSFVEPFTVTGTVIGPKLVARSGATGAKLWEWLDPEYDLFVGATAVAAVEDLNGDGLQEIVYAKAKEGPWGGGSGFGMAYVLSGADGSLFHTFWGTLYAPTFGTSVTALDDLDADGVGDFAIGALHPPGGLPFEGAAIVFSGATLQPLHTLTGLQAYGEFGAALLRVPDQDGDGLRDLAVGAPGQLQGRGRVAVYSSSTWQLLASWNGRLPGQRFGQSLSSSEAGFPSGSSSTLFVGSPSSEAQAFGGSVSLIDLRSGREEARWIGDLDGSAFSGVVAGAGLMDEDQHPDFLVSTRRREDGWHYSTGFSLRSGDPRTSSEPSGGGVELWGLGHLPHPQPGGIASFDSGAGLSSSFAVVAPGGENGIYRWRPFLTAQPNAISAAQGGQVDYLIDFPASRAAEPYALLFSLHGPGSSWIRGVEVPLTADRFTFAGLSGHAPPGVIDAYGQLDAHGDATATLTAAPGALAALINRTFGAAAIVSRDPVTAHPSAAAVVQVTP